MLLQFCQVLFTILNRKIISDEENTYLLHESRIVNYLLTSLQYSVKTRGAPDFLTKLFKLSFHSQNYGQIKQIISLQKVMQYALEFLIKLFKLLFNFKKITNRQRYSSYLLHWLNLFNVKDYTGWLSNRFPLIYYYLRLMITL